MEEKKKQSMIEILNLPITLLLVISAVEWGVSHKGEVLVYSCIVPIIFIPINIGIKYLAGKQENIKKRIAMEIVPIVLVFTIWKIVNTIILKIFVY